MLLSSLQTTLVSHLLKPLWSKEVEKVEELFQVILQRGPRQQQLMIYLVAIEDPEKLGSGTRTGKGKKGLSAPSGCLTSQTCPSCQLLNSHFPQDQRPQP